MTENTPDSPDSKPLAKKVAVGFLGILSFCWIFIPEPTDMVPVLGWLDEAAAAGIFLACLNYLGVPVSRLKSIFTQGEKTPQAGDEPNEKPVEGKVVEN